MAAATLAPTASAASGCDRYASPTGSDSSGTGSLNHPFGSVQGLDAALKPGQTGCLLAGTYGSVSTSHRLATNGTAQDPITITSAPGQQAKVVGLVEVEGSYTTVAGLSIDGSNNLYTGRRSGTNCAAPVSNGLEIDGTGDVFEDNDFYQSVAALRGNGIGIGWNHPADNAVIRDNRIHDLGQCQAYDQMIYLAHGTGVQIYDNWMWNDRHGWGIQVYPNASDAHIYDNVIDGAGSGIVLGGSDQVADNTIDHNIIMNSTGLPAAGVSGVGISTCCGLGSGNSFTDNVVYNNPGGIAAASGVSLSGNTTSAPNLADVTSHDYRTTSHTPSALTDWSLWDGGDDTGPVAVPAAAHTRAKVAHTRRRRARRRAAERRHVSRVLGARFQVRSAAS
ncbi:MAG TPA: right-handed parallel beta-helix repeat-containing protein [Solirubrobacteraceae bacterium]|nr:right-handed parallel beta-helix repeat-containing protein [Solirubrobacteraceae bacterium]